MQQNMTNQTFESVDRVKIKYLGAKPSQILAYLLLGAIIGAVFIVLVMTSGETRFRIQDVESEYDATVISALLEEIDNYYYFSDEAPETGALLEHAAKTLVSDVGDPYAAYYTEEEYTSFRNELDGNYKGIGVLVGIADDESGLIVTRAYVGNPAYEAGVRDGDIIVSVDNKPLEGVSLDEASEMLLGEDDSIAQITVLRDGQEMSFSIVRGDVHVTPVFSEQLENGVGYICIEQFTGNASEAFNDQLQALLDAGITSLIIDVRNNPGGSLDVVIDICDRILPDCLIMTLEGKLCDPPVEYRSTDEEQLDIPYVILTNENSASASEVFASAVQDNDKAQIVGINTFGKGIVQTSWSLGEGLGYIKITTDVYRTPDGDLIHGIGVKPDIEVEQAEQLKGIDPYYIMRDAMDADVQLEAAIESLINNK